MTTLKLQSHTESNILDVRIPEHERLVKRVVFQRVSGSGLGRKGLFAMLQHYKIAAGFVAGATMTFALIGGAYTNRDNVALAGYNPFATDSAKAKFVVRGGMHEAKKLSPEDRAKIEAKIKADMKASLDEAMQAPDVKVLPKGETGMTSNGNFGFAASGDVSGKKVLVVNGEPAHGEGHMAIGGFAGGEVEKRVSYTDKQGHKIILGLNNEGLPIFKAVEFSSEAEGQVDMHMQTHIEAGMEPFNIAIPAVGGVSQ